MRKKLHYLLLLVSPLLFAQLPGSLIRSTTESKEFEDYMGSIYKTRSYKDANVIDEKSGTFDAKLRYNVHLDALEYSGEGEDLYKVIKIPTVHARVDGEYFYYCSFQSQRNQNREGYYVLLEMNDSYRIYKKYSLKVTEPKRKSLSSSGSSATEPGSLRIITTYYLEEEDVIMKLPMKKKDFLAAFGDKEEELKNYIKNEKIRLKKEEDLVRVVSRYNALKNTDASQQQSLLSNRDRRN